LNDDIKSLEKKIKIIKKKNEELELENKGYKKEIRLTKNDHLLVIIMTKNYYLYTKLSLFNLIGIDKNN
jgi:hypothetical protein